jgi:hypothetical protein
MCLLFSSVPVIIMSDFQLPKIKTEHEERQLYCLFCMTVKCDILREQCKLQMFENKVL